MRGKRVRKAVAMSDAGIQSYDDGSQAGVALAADRLIVIGTEFDVSGSIYIDARVRLEGTV